MLPLLASPTAHVLRFDRGEEVMSGLKNFCEKEGIEAASFSALGAAGHLVLSWYELATKTYHDHTYDGEYEIIGITGNVGLLDNQIIIHAHGSFSDQSMRPVSGHIKECVVSLTCEVTIQVLPGSLRRKKDEATGLNLLAA